MGCGSEGKAKAREDRRKSSRASTPVPNNITASPLFLLIILMNDRRRGSDLDENATHRAEAMTANGHGTDVAHAALLHRFPPRHE